MKSFDSLAYSFTKSCAATAVSCGFTPTKETLSFVLAAAASNAGNSRLQGSQVENQKFTTMGFPRRVEKSIAVPARSSNERAGNNFPAAGTLVPLVGSAIVSEGLSVTVPRSEVESFVRSLRSHPPPTLTTATAKMVSSRRAVRWRGKVTSSGYRCH